jgi:hypothetical protein
LPDVTTAGENDRVCCQSPFTNDFSTLEGLPFRYGR